MNETYPNTPACRNPCIAQAQAESMGSETQLRDRSRRETGGHRGRERERAWRHIGMVTAGKNNFDKMLLWKAKAAETRNAQNKRNPIPIAREHPLFPPVASCCCLLRLPLSSSRKERAAATELTICATPTAPSAGRTWRRGTASCATADRAGSSCHQPPLSPPTLPRGRQPVRRRRCCPRRAVAPRRTGGASPRARWTSRRAPRRWRPGPGRTGAWLRLQRRRWSRRRRRRVSRLARPPTRRTRRSRRRTATAAGRPASR